MGRYIFNQNLAQMASHFGLPTYPGDQPITFEFPTVELQRQLPDFPADGKLEITFVRGGVRRITIHPDVRVLLLFQFLFQYAPPTQLIVFAHQITGGYNDIRCLGDGVGAETQMQGNGDNFTSFYYSEDFIAPYNLLEEQQYILDAQNLDNQTETQDHQHLWLSERLVTDADLNDKDFKLLFVMHHSIYARKGLIFYNGFLKRVFQKQSWYSPIYKTAQFRKEVLPNLSPIEKANLEFLLKRFLEQWNN